VVIATLTLCLYALRSRITKAGSKFEHALHATGGRFYEAQDDGTGYWLTHWFPSSSRPTFLKSTERQPTPVQRCPVYTYMDTETPHGSNEFDILRIWMKAFWALGFKPIVLTDKDSRRDAHYILLRNSGLLADARFASLRKWLAMAQYGGLFVDYHVTPFEFLGIKFLI
jgi:hypothetical protein